MTALRMILIASLTMLLAACSTTPKLNLVKSSGVSMELTRPTSYVFSALISPDGKYALSGSLDNTVNIWDMETGRRIKLLKHLAGVTPGVSALAMSQDGGYLLTGLKGGGWTKLWDSRSWQEIRELPGHSFTEAMEEFAFSDSTKYALTGGTYQIKRWELATGRELGHITHASFFDRNQSTAIAFSPDGRLAFVKGIGFISLWDIITGRRLWIYGANTGGRRWSGGKIVIGSSAKFSPDGIFILSGEDMTLKVRDARSGAVVRTFSDETMGQIDAVAFSPDGNYALSGSVDKNIRLWDVRTGKKLREFTGHSDEITSVSFSPDAKRILSGGDASARLWDVATGEELVAMMGFGENEWLVITPEGYYNASENAGQYLSVMVGENRYGVDRFYDVFYRPDVVAAKLRGEEIKDLISITMQDAINSPPPIVEFAATPSNNDQPKVEVCYQVRNSGGGIGEVRLFHNGKLIKSDGYYRDMAKFSAEKGQLMALNSKAIYENMRSLSIKYKGDIVPARSSLKGDALDNCVEVEAVSGENEVSAAAFNGSNTVQSHMKTARFNSSINPEEAHLYILSIGIDNYRDNKVNLKYAAKDAADIEQNLLRQSATLYKPQNIHHELLTDSNANKGGIADKITELSKVIKPYDGFILFVAGHGILLQNQYYMVTSDFDGTLSDRSMISSNEIVEMSKKIKSLSQLLIFDTCHAGGVDAIVSGLYDARMSVLAKKMGLHIYASANSIEEALDGYQGNGLFTHALLDGLNNRQEADRNRDNKVSLVELGEYAKQTTMKISQKAGHGQTPLIINFGKDNTLYQLR